MIRYFVFIIASFFLLSPPALADERARNGKCFVTIGYANDRSQVSEMATNSFINSDYFELFERKDKQVYLTLGKIDEKLFKKLQAENKTYDFGCSRGKGYEKRFGLNADFQMVAGNKKFLDTEAQFLSVVASIEIEKQRIVDAEVEKQVQARVEKLEKKRKEEEAAKIEAEKEKQRLAKIEEQRKAEAAAEVERQVQARVAELEKQRQADEAEEVERQVQARVAELEKQRQADEAAQKEKLRLARIAVDTEKASKLGFNSIDDMNFAIAAGFKDANSYNAVANELNQAFETSGLAKKEWLFLLNKLGGTALLDKFKKETEKEMGAGWPKQAEYQYKFAANIPKLLLKCNGRHGYYVIAHLFTEKPYTADFLYVDKGQSYARDEFYNVLGTQVVLYDTNYAYPYYEYNNGNSPVRYLNVKASVNRNSGQFNMSYQNPNPTYRSDVRGSMEFYSFNDSYSCNSWDDVERYQNLKSDYIKFTKAEA